MFGVNPYKLSEEDFGQLMGEALWLKKQEIELLEGVITRAVARAFTVKKKGK